MHATVEIVGGDVPGGDPGARDPIARREGVLLTLRDDGVCGVGEASPLPGYSPDTLAAAHAELASWQPEPLDPGARPAVLLARAAGGVRAPSARFAIESAALDWIGRRTGLPVHRVLGAARPTPAIALGYLLPVAGAAEHASALRRRGIRHLKLKIGADLDAELRALRAVRAAVPDADVRLDANGRLPVGDVPALCAAYCDAGVTLVEEPCDAEALATLPRLAVPVALDESLGRTDAAALVAAVARAQTLAAVVLKPTALGGFTRGLALAALGREAGAEPIVTHTFDGPVAMAAAAELALALPGARLAGLAPHACLRAYPRREAAALGERALTGHDVPGLGLRECP